MMSRPGAVAALLIPVSAIAQETTYLSDPAFCDEPTSAAHEAGVMSLFPTGTETIEYGCSWEEPIVFDWSETSTQIRPGYCAELGEYIYPQVFAFGMSDFEPGVVLVWSSEVETGEPVRYSACE